jgi:hypothetical protein
MKGLDFWATDAWTDSGVPIFDEWSVAFELQELTREIMRDEVMLAIDKMYRNQTR